MYCRLELRNFHAHTVHVPVSVSLAADFADVFEVRGVRSRAARGNAMVPKTRADQIVFGYEGQDSAFRETIVELDPRPRATGSRMTAPWCAGSWP